MEIYVNKRHYSRLSRSKIGDSGPLKAEADSLHYLRPGTKGKEGGTTTHSSCVPLPTTDTLPKTSLQLRMKTFHKQERVVAAMSGMDRGHVGTGSAKRVEPLPAPNPCRPAVPERSMSGPHSRRRTYYSVCTYLRRLPGPGTQRLTRVMLHASHEPVILL